MAASDPPPLSIRLIWQIRDQLRRRRRKGLLALAAVITVVWLADGFFTIENGESGALLRFGSMVHDTVSPGLHYRLPLGIDEVVEKRTGEVFRLEIAGNWVPNLSLVSGDENLIAVATVVQYRILRLGAYLFATDNSKAIIHQTVRAELLEAAAGLTVDDLLTSGKASLQRQVQLRSQEKLDAYGLGVGLVSVNLQEVAPPPEAEDAFRAVLDARADADRGISMADSRADRRLGLARGTAAQLVSAAEAEADRRRQEARGAARRFEVLRAQYRRAPELTRTELYNRTVQEALPRTRIIVLPPGDLEHLDLNVVDPPGDPSRSGSKR